MDDVCAWCGRGLEAPERTRVVPTALGGSLAFHLPACPPCRAVLRTRPVLALVGQIAYGLAWAAADPRALGADPLRPVRALARGESPAARVTGPVFVDDGPEEVAALLRPERDRVAVYVRVGRACFRVDLEDAPAAWRQPVAVCCGADADGLGLQTGAGAAALAGRVVPPGLAPPLAGRSSLRTGGPA
jgi:hypothetical protein